MKHDEEHNNKIINLPVEYEGKKSREKEPEEKKNNHLSLIISIIGLIIPIVIAIVTIFTQIKLSEKSEVESKPILDFNFEYFKDDYYEDIPLNKERKYLKSMSINMSNNNSKPIDIMIEPFFNILYYSQSKEGMIKQLLPIHDCEGLYDFFLMKL